MPDTAPAFHELYLLLVQTHERPIRVSFHANYKAIRKGDDLQIIAYASHRTALWHEIPEAFDCQKNIGLRQRVRIVLFDAG